MTQDRHCVHLNIKGKAKSESAYAICNCILKRQGNEIIKLRFFMNVLIKWRICMEQRYEKKTQAFFCRWDGALFSS